MKNTNILAILLLLPILSTGQVLSSKGRFSIGFDKGCAPMTVTITPLDNFGNVTRQYYFFDEAGITNQETFTYQDAGRYRIVQVVGVDGIDDKTDTVFVDVQESIRPEIEITRCANLELNIQSYDSYYDSVRVYFTPMDSATLEFGEQTSYLFSSAAAQNVRLKGFFDNADENCADFTEIVTPSAQLLAPELRSVAIKETCKDVYTAYLQLADFDAQTKYEILLQQGANTSALYEGFISSRLLSFTVNSFVEDSYCLQVNAVNTCNSSVVQGSPLCRDIEAVSLTPFESLYSTYSDSGIFIQLDSLGIGSFEINRRIEGEEFEFYRSITGSFVDPIGSQGRKYFYQISYVDSCGQVLHSAETHPPFLTAESTTDNIYQVSFETGQNSLLENPTNTFEVGNPGSSTRSDFSGANFEVRLEARNGSPRQLLFAESRYSDVILKSNTLTLRHQLVIYVPNAFTPNDDGLNDEISFFGIPSENAAIRIYSRWGKLVYTEEGPQPSWDGTINGTLAPEGTYLYEIRFQTSTGEMKYQKGTFALIKK